MKSNVILAVVVIAALTIAGVGGTFATWADSEVSLNNTITTGSVDLKVNGADDLPYGTGVPAKVTIECMIPLKLYGPYEVELWNAGQCTFPSHAYLHVKNATCSNALPKTHPETGATTGYPDPSTGETYSGDLKPEPELVAEYGGKVNCVYVEGVGVDGDDCSMGSGIRMTITNSTDPEDVLRNPNNMLLTDLFYKWECQEIYLFDLWPCNARTIYLWFSLDQDSEDDFPHLPDLIKHPDDLGMTQGTPEYANALLHWQKFNDWPSWRYMKDKITFDMEFDLWLEDTPGSIVCPG